MFVGSIFSPLLTGPTFVPWVISSNSLSPVNLYFIITASQHSRRASLFEVYSSFLAILEYASKFVITSRLEVA